MERRADLGTRRYYVAINRRVIEQSAHKIAQLNCVRFLKDKGSAQGLLRLKRCNVVERGRADGATRASSMEKPATQDQGWIQAALTMPGDALAALSSKVG